MAFKRRGGPFCGRLDGIVPTCDDLAACWLARVVRASRTQSRTQSRRLQHKRKEIKLHRDGQTPFLMRLISTCSRAQS